VLGAGGEELTGRHLPVERLAASMHRRRPTGLRPAKPADPTRVGAACDRERVIPKSGNRFSEKITRKTKT
jgi:hypothetical protein